MGKCGALSIRRASDVSLPRIETNETNFICRRNVRENCIPNETEKHDITFTRLYAINTPILTLTIGREMCPMRSTRYSLECEAANASSGAVSLLSSHYQPGRFKQIAFNYKKVVGLISFYSDSTFTKISYCCLYCIGRNNLALQCTRIA